MGKKALQTDVDLSKNEKIKIGRMIHHDYIDSPIQTLKALS